MTVGSISITSLILVGLGPLAWLAYSVWVTREASLRRVLGAGAPSSCSPWGCLRGGCRVWFSRDPSGSRSCATPRGTSGRHSRRIQPSSSRDSATGSSTATTSSASGSCPSHGYMSWVLPLSFLLPRLGALVGRSPPSAAGCSSSCSSLSVLSSPWAVTRSTTRPPPARCSRRSRSGTSAWRSAARRGPLHSSSCHWQCSSARRPGALGPGASAAPVTALVAVLVVANLPALWVGQIVDRPPPATRTSPVLARRHPWLDDKSHETRVLEMPGTDFAAYRWGNTVDPVTPASMDRPYGLELVPLGRPPLSQPGQRPDRPLQEETFDPDALAPSPGCSAWATSSCGPTWSSSVSGPPGPRPPGPSSPGPGPG